jgi:16S rRNA (guanine966-N2)-methyltransferase
MRVVAGSLRGRRIESPRGGNTRPTTDKVREAVFNALASLGEIDEARVADIFAGTGAMGIEALSRGATHCTFVENDRRALEALAHNLETLGLGSSSTVVRGDATSAVLGAEVTLVIADPPYDFEGWPELLARVGRDCPRALVVAEAGRAVEAPAGWEAVRCRRYGRTTVTFLRVAPGEPVP